MSKKMLPDKPAGVKAETSSHSLVIALDVLAESMYRLHKEAAERFITLGC